MLTINNINFFALIIGICLIPRFNDFLIPGLIAINLLTLIYLNVNKIIKIIYILLTIYLFYLNKEIFYALINLPIIILFIKLTNKNDIKCYFFTILLLPILLSKVYHITINIFNNGYIENPIQYRDFGFFIILLGPIVLENIKNKKFLFIITQFVLLFISYVTNSRLCIYITVISTVLVSTNLNELKNSLINIIFSIILFITLSSNQYLGELIHRLKFGISSPTRYNENWPNSINKIIDNSSIIEVNPHNLFLNISIVYGKYWGLLTIIIAISTLYLVAVNNRDNLRKSGLFLSYTSFLIYSFYENSHINILLMFTFYSLYKFNLLKNNLIKLNL